MKRLLSCIAVALALSASAVAATVSAQAGVALQPDASVEDSDILLADLFGGLEPRLGETVIAKAPDPGRHVVFDASLLARIADAYDIEWRPTSRADRVRIDRDATIIDADMLTELVIEAVRDRGIDQRLEVSLDADDLEMRLPPHHALDAAITRLEIDFDRGRFTAVALAPDAHAPVARMQLRGRLHTIEEVPVVSRRMRNGDVITSRDLRWIDMRSNQLAEDTILDEEALIGMTARRTLVADRPIRERQIQPPQLVSRGQTVTMRLENGALTISAQGRALEDGSEGEWVRVENVSSHEVIEAQVRGDRLVQVYPTTVVTN